MNTISFRGRPWKVTPFHCVVGDIRSDHWREIDAVWHAGLPMRARPASNILTPGAFSYVCTRRSSIEAFRKTWATRPYLFFTNDPLYVNEMQPEECTLACIDNGEIILTNFRDLPDFEVASKIYALGEFWLSYATGGAELPLRFGGPRT